ncbi:uncharacterized protein [Onthophagus taurus]|uniref:uncharacterized protein n=1 Tax=Onthophagus taurus TaxID=166361 RepID=UPI0039BEC9E1
MFPVFIKIAIIAVVAAAATTGIIVGIIVSVVPTVDKTCLELEPASNLNVEHKENHIIIKWSPSSSSSCNIQYLLSVAMDGDENPAEYNTTETFFTISKMPKLCTTMEVNVTVVGEEMKSDSVSLLYFVQPSQEDVNGVAMTIEQEDQNSKIVTWTDYGTEFDECEVTYSLTVNDSPIETELTTNTYTFTNELMENCKSNKVEVVATVSGVIGTPGDISIVVPPTQDAVNDITMTIVQDGQNSKFVTWTDYGTEFEGCEVTYSLSVNGIPIETELTTNTYIFTNELTEICKNMVKVVASVSGVIGTPGDISIVVPPTQDAVNDITMTIVQDGENSKFVTWTDYGTEFEGCEVTYSLTVNGIPIETELTTNTYTFTNELTETCKNMVKVVASVSGVFGTAGDISIVVPPTQDAVNDITMTIVQDEENSKLVTWTDYGTEFEGCEVTYSLSVNGIPIETELTTNTYTFTNELTENCKSNKVEVVASVSGVIGTPGDISIVVPPTQDAVNDITMTIVQDGENSKFVTWTDYGTEFEGCEVTYSLTVNGIPIETELTTNTYTFTNELTETCKNMVKVVASVSGVFGTAGDISIVVPPTQDAVNDITMTAVQDEENSKLVTWTDYGTEFEGCEVTYSLAVNGIAIETELTTNTYTFTNELTETCKNMVKVVASVSGVFGTAGDISIVVPPTQDAVNDITMTIVQDGENSKFVTWTDYGTEFEGCEVTYSLTVNGIPIETELTTNTYTFTNELTETCKNMVKVVASVSGVFGTAGDISIVVPPTQDAVNDITMTIVQDEENSKLVTWTDYGTEFEGCEVTYSLSVNGIPIETELTTNTYTFTNELTENCKSNKVEVVASVSGVIGTPGDISIVVPPTQDAVNDITMTIVQDGENSKFVTWTDYGTEFEGCEVTYSLTVNGIPIETELTTNTYTFTNELTETCKNMVKVVASVSGVFGTAGDISIVVPPTQDAVNDITMTAVQDEENSKLVTWTDYGTEFEGCEVTYSLAVNGIAIETELTTNTYTFTNELTETCKNMVKVVASVSGVFGTAGDISIVVPPTQDAVNDITMTIVQDGENSKFVTWTDYGTEFEGCEVTYSLTVNGIPIETELTTNTYTFTNELTETCKNMVKVVASVSGVFGTAGDISIVVPPTQDAVNDITMTIVQDGENSKFVTWTDYGTEFEGCEVTYSLTVNGIPIETELTTNTYTFTNELMENCKSNKVEVVASVSGIIGTPGDISIVVPPTQDAVNDITMTIVQDEENSKFVTWTDYGTEFEGCEVTYSLTVNGIPIETELTTNTYTFTNELTETCKNMVKVVASVSGVFGTAGDISIVVPPTQDAVNDITMIIVQDGENSKFVTWTDYGTEFEGCEVTYSLTVNGIPIETELTTNTYTFTNELMENCKSNKVEVVASVSGIIGTPGDISIVVPPTQEAVNDITMTIVQDEENSKFVTWTDYGTEFEGCEVTYSLTVNGIPIETELTTNTYTFTNELTETCKNMVKVVASVSGVFGTAGDISIVVPPTQDAVNDITMIIVQDGENSKFVTWTDYGTEFEGCEVTYSLTVNGIAIETELTTNTYTFTNELTETCKNMVKVVASVSGVFGTAGDISIVVPPTQDAVNDITMTIVQDEENSKFVTWTDYGTEFEGCEVTYSLTVNGIPIETELTTNTYTFTNELTETCKNMVKVVASVSGVFGTAGDISIVVPPTQDAVNDITMTIVQDGENSKFVTWTDYGTEFEGCEVTYSLTVNGIPIETELTTNTYTFTNELTETCKNMVKVVASVSGVFGTAGDISIVVPPTQDAVNDITMIIVQDGENSKFVTWTDYGTEFEGCEVTYSLTVNGIPIETELTTNTYTFTNELMENCKSNKVEVVASVSGIIGTPGDISIVVPPTQEAVNDITMTIVQDEENSKFVTWTDYGTEFEGCEVTYSLTVNGIPIETELTTNTYTFTNELTETCKNMVKVVASVSGVFGTAGDISIVVPPTQDAVNDITMIIVQDGENSKFVTWTDYGTEFEGCEVTYSLTVNGIAIETELTTNTYTFTNELTETCKNMVKVVASVSGVFGTAGDISIVVPPTQDAVNDITMTIVQDEENSKFVTWTDYGTEFEGCEVTYSLTVNGIPIETELTTNTYTFTNELTETCKNMVKVVASVSGVFGTAGDISIVVPPTQDAVNDITMTIVQDGENSKFVTWTDYGTEFEGCEVTYSLTVNGIPIETELTTNTYTFTNELTETCKNMVKVVASVSGVFGTAGDISIVVPPTQDAVNDITMIIVQDGENSKFVTWTDYGTEFEGCEVTYSLTVNGIPIETELTTNTYTFTNELMENCKSNKVEVVASVSGIIGTPGDISIVVPPTQEAVNDITMTIVQDEENSKFVTWTDYGTEFEGCEVTYSLTVNGIPIETELTTNTYTFTNELMENCKSNKVEVVASVSGIIGTPGDISIVVPPTQDAVNDITMIIVQDGENSKFVTWTDYGTEFEGCEVTYSLTVNGIPIETELTTNTYTFTNELMENCKSNKVEVVASVSGIIGTPGDISIVVPPTQEAVNDITMTIVQDEENSKFVTWTDYGTEFEGCEVTYSLTVNGIPIETELTTNTYTFTNELTETCKNMVKVVASVSGVFGTAGDISIVVPPTQDAVNDITMIIVQDGENSKFVTWTDYGTEFEGCEVTYSLTVNGIAIETELTTNTYTFTNELTETCKNMVKVVASVSGVFGTAGDISIVVPPTQDAVNDITMTIVQDEENSKFVTWTDYGTEFEGCEVTYSLTVNGIPIETELTTNTYTFTNELTENCKSNKVEVVASISGVIGTPGDISIVVPPTQDAVNDITMTIVQDEENSKFVTWTDYGTEFEGCEVTYSLTVNGIPIETELTTNTYTFTNELTETCKNMVKVVASVSGVIGTSGDISIEELPPVEDGSFKFLGAENIEVSWKSPNIGSESCTFMYDLKLKETGASDFIIDHFDNWSTKPFLWKPNNIDGINDCGDMIVTITTKSESKSGTSVTLDCEPQNLIV